MYNDEIYFFTKPIWLIKVDSDANEMDFCLSSYENILSNILGYFLCFVTLSNNSI